MQTPGFLVKFDGTNWTHYSLDRSFLSYAVDSNDVIWVGTTFGLRKFEDGAITSYFEFNTDPITNTYFNVRAIADIIIDENGIFWYVLEMNDMGNCRVFSVENNYVSELTLPVYSPFIRELYLDQNGVKWIITNTFKWSELIKVSPNGESTMYTKDDWNWTLYNFWDITSDSKGGIYVASGTYGLIKFKGYAL